MMVVMMVVMMLSELEQFDWLPCEPLVVNLQLG